jgi:hypothetical protein
MYGTLAMLAVLLVIAGLLVLFRSYSASMLPPYSAEGFAVAAVNSILAPACTERSTQAQSLLQRIAVSDENKSLGNEGNKEELRLLLSKLCCLEADLITPAAGAYRTLPLQFRTSHDTDAASTLVGRCFRNAIRQRDIDIIVEKFQVRGLELVGNLVGPNEVAEAKGEFMTVITLVKTALQTTCLTYKPRLDAPEGPRDVGFWEPKTAAGLAQYQGISAEPK